MAAEAHRPEPRPDIIPDLLDNVVSIGGPPRVEWDEAMLDKAWAMFKVVRGTRDTQFYVHTAGDDDRFSLVSIATAAGWMFIQSSDGSAGIPHFNVNPITIDLRRMLASTIVTDLFSNIHELNISLVPRLALKTNAACDNDTSRVPFGSLQAIADEDAGSCLVPLMDEDGPSSSNQLVPHPHLLADDSYLRVAQQLIDKPDIYTYNVHAGALVSMRDPTVRILTDLQELMALERLKV